MFIACDKVHAISGIYVFCRLQGLFLGISGRGVKLTVHLHLGLRFSMCGVIPPLPHVPCWDIKGQLHFTGLRRISICFAFD
jgi:hypothetical protein